MIFKNVILFSLILGTVSLYANILNRVALTANEQKRIEALETKLEDNITRKEKVKIVKEIQKYKRAKELKELAIKQIQKGFEGKQFSKLEPLLKRGDIEGAIQELDKIDCVSLDKKLRLKAEEL